MCIKHCDLLYSVYKKKVFYSPIFHSKIHKHLGTFFERDWGGGGGGKHEKGRGGKQGGRGSEIGSFE